VHCCQRSATKTSSAIAEEGSGYVPSLLCTQSYLIRQLIGHGWCDAILAYSSDAVKTVEGLRLKEGF